MRVNPVPMNVGHGGGLVACSSSSRRSQRKAQPNGSYLALVAMNGDGEWQFMYPCGDSLDNTPTPFVYEDHMAEDLLEIWKRAVLDGAIPMSSYWRRETLRIVRFRMHAVDATGELFEDRGQQLEYQRLMAVAKLTDDEARLLGLDVLKAKQKLLHCPDNHPDDQKTLSRLSQENLVFDLSVALSEIVG